MDNTRSTPVSTVASTRSNATRRNGIALAFLLAAAIVVAGYVAFSKKPKPKPPPVVDAEGVVLLDGKPLKRVRVRFVPVGDYPTECQASGVTDDDGRFTLTCRDQSGASACENIVVVEESELPLELRGMSDEVRKKKTTYYQKLGGRPLPSRYSGLAANPLLVNVTAEKKKYTVALTSEQDLSP